MECVCSDIEHFFNIILGKETGTTFPISVQEVNPLLDTGAEKSCMSMGMFAKLKLPLNVAKVPKLRNASGRDIKTHGVMTMKFKIGNTIFIQEFVVCDNLVISIIISRDFTVNNFIGIAWTRQGTKKVTKDDKIIIEIEEPTSKKTLTMTRKVMIPPRSYAVFNVEGEEGKGKYEIRPNPFLKQREPNLWMDNFVLYNVRSNLAIHHSDTPFIIWQPICRPRLLEGVYKPICIPHWCGDLWSLLKRTLEIGCK